MVPVDLSSRGSGGVLVWFPSRLLLAGSVLGALVASSSTALTMTGDSDDATVDVPEFAHTSGPAAPTSAPTSATAGSPVTGAQIAALALTPARDRTAALIAERDAAAAEAVRAEAQRQAARPAPAQIREDDISRLRAEIRRACDDGRLRGGICRGA
jgi:hypothetical protein